MPAEPSSTTQPPEELAEESRRAFFGPGQTPDAEQDFVVLIAKAIIRASQDNDVND